MNFLQLKKNIKKDFSTFTTVKIALLGDTPTQLLHTALKGYGFEAQLNFDIYEPEFQQAEREIMDSGSGLYTFKPAFAIVFFAAEELLKKFARLPLHEKHVFAEKQLSHYETLLTTYSHNGSGNIILLNFCMLPDNVYGNFANKTSASFTWQLRAINAGLMQLAQKHNNLFIVDIDALQTMAGFSNRLNQAVYINTGIVTEPGFLVGLVKNITQVVQAVQGRFNKCIIVDLDNTMWGGVIGDDGINNIQIGSLGIGKVFTDLQLWVKQLKERGIIVAVCSKNDEAVAREAFEQHPEMELRMDDIAVFAVNWDNKADNIRYIQKVLNIGLDSMVFIDDNPFERNLVRKELPAVTVPELPEDPAGYLAYLQQLNLFETASFTLEDTHRNGQYKKEAERIKAKEIFTNEDDYLASLDMRVKIGRFNSFSIPRIAQLSQRSNQFNLRTIRYAEKDVERIAGSNDYLVFDFSLADKYGDYGLVSMVVLQKQQDAYFIENWLMSCRVLKRGMENFVLNYLVHQALSQGAVKLLGEYLPTAKNSMVKDFFATLGFVETAGGRWQLNLDTFVPLKTFINRSV